MNNISEVSKKIRDHLTNQQARSIMDHSQSCAYRGQNGTMCAVGCLINDDIYTAKDEGGDPYSSKLEQLAVTASNVIGAVERSVGFELDAYERNVLRLWQQYHDVSACLQDPYREFSYRAWLEKREGSKSPDEVHDALMMHLEQIRLRDISLKIRNHLTKQNAQSKFPGNSNCAYRGDGGTMCAVGCLITDEVYAAVESGGETHVENRCAGHPAVQQAIKESLKLEAFGSRLELKLLEAWQQYHDDYYYTAEHSFNYGDWVKAPDEQNSPGAFHSAIMHTLVSTQ